MTLRRLAALYVAQTCIMAGLFWGFAQLVPPKRPDALPTAGVPGCTKTSTRTVKIPAGVTVGLSCPTHIQVESYDEDVSTLLTFRRP